jgi:hypothetical protein
MIDATTAKNEQKTSSPRKYNTILIIKVSVQSNQYNLVRRNQA